MKRAIILIFFFNSWLQAQVYEFNTSQLAHWNEAGETYSDVWGYAAGGREYAIMGSASRIYFFDVTSPSNPILVDQFGPYTSTSWREFKTYSHYAYAVTDGPDQGGLRIFDLQYLPDTVIQVRQTTEFFSKCHMPFIDETNARLYCAGTNTRSNGIIVLDLLSRPDSPSVIIDQALPRGYVHDLFVKNNMVYASHGINGISQYNCAGDSCSGELSNFFTGGYNHSSWMNADNTLLVNAIETAGHPLWLFNINNGVISSEGFKKFKSITLKDQSLNLTDTGNIGHNPYFVGNRVFVSYYTDGVQVYDLSNVNNITRIAYFDTDRGHTSYSPVFRGCWGVYPFLPSGNILASDIQSGLWIFRVNEAALPISYSKISGRLIHPHQIDLTVEFIAGTHTLQVLVEKSQDGKFYEPFIEIKDWKDLVKFNANFKDQNVLNENYFRIKLIGEDGSATYSEELLIKNVKTAFKIWPNPVVTRLNFQSDTTLIRISILDLQGKIIFQQAYPQTAIDLPDSLSNGIYIVETYDGISTDYNKIIVQR